MALSDDNVSFTTVLTNNLPDARNKDCGPDIPLLEFNILKGARYVKFTIISFYGIGPALQHINFLFI